MIIYLAMTLGTFAIILSLRRRDVMFEKIEDLSGLSRTHPWLAFCLAAMMFSLAGIPPLAGFFAKFYVFAAAIKAGLVTLAVIGVVTSVVGAYYYLRLVKIMYFDEPKEPYEAMAPGLRVVLALSSVVVVLFFLLPGTAGRRRRPGRPVAVLGRSWLPTRTRGARRGHRLHVHDTLGSTNSEAMAQARAGETGPLWVVTHRQECRPWPARQRLGLAARQPRGKRALAGGGRRAGATRRAGLRGRPGADRGAGGGLRHPAGSVPPLPPDLCS